MGIEDILNFRNLRLRSIWSDDYESRLNTMRFIASTWHRYADAVYKFYDKDKEYVILLVHDGNVACGALNSVIHIFEHEGRIPADMQGWTSTYPVLDWIRHAEVYLLWKGVTI